MTEQREILQLDEPAEGTCEAPATGLLARWQRTCGQPATHLLYPTDQDPFGCYLCDRHAQASRQLIITS